MFFLTDYLYYDYAKSAVCKVKEAKKEYVSSPSVERYLDKLCMENGSTLEGRKKAYQHTMEQTHYIPIVLQENPHRIFFPIKSLKDPENIWICYEEINHIEYHKKTCTIVFHDHTCLTCEYPARIRKQMRTIFRYLRRSND